jgi:hypothetical protein
MVVRRLYSLGVGLLCIGVFCLLITPAGSAPRYASVMAVIVCLILIALSFTAPHFVAWSRSQRASSRPSTSSRPYATRHDAT